MIKLIFDDVSTLGCCDGDDLGSRDLFDAAVVVVVGDDDVGVIQTTSR